jgi:hypothetical protein
LPLSCGRPSAADRQLQRLVRQLQDKEPARRKIVIVFRGFCGVTDCHRDDHSAYDRRSKIRPQPISPPKRIPVEEFRTRSPRTSLSNALPFSGEPAARAVR